MKACHSIGTTLIESIPKIGTQSYGMKSTRKVLHGFSPLARDIRLQMLRISSTGNKLFQAQRIRHMRKDDKPRKKRERVITCLREHGTATGINSGIEHGMRVEVSPLRRTNTNKFCRWVCRREDIEDVYSLFSSQIIAMT
jgi:hypothetical protein